MAFLVEFRNVATRPIAVNGLGLAPAVAEAKAADFEALFPLLPDTPDIHRAWKAPVTGASVIGKRVHDAGLVAGADPLFTRLKRDVVLAEHACERGLQAATARG